VFTQFPPLFDVAKLFIIKKTSQWFSLGSPVSSTNKTDHHDKAEILLKMALSTINPYISNHLLFRNYIVEMVGQILPDKVFCIYFI
jgi:hypothetical protein